MKALYIPECLTPLAWTPIYSGLAPADRFAYNRLHGLYFLEQTIFFEQIMGQPALAKIIRIAPDEALRQEARDFADEENAHSSWFRELLRSARPEWYATSDYHLLSASAPMRRGTSFLARHIQMLPALLWLQLMSEERALYFGRTFVRHAAELDPAFLAVQRRHMADEAAHIRRDELFIEWLWRRTPSWWRRCNAGWLKWMLREFFHLPKRSGLHVVDHWLAECPHLQPRREEFHRAVLALKDNTAYIKTLYPRRHLPRTAALSREWPELAFLDTFLTG